MVHSCTEDSAPVGSEAVAGRRQPGRLRVLIVDDDLDCAVSTRLVCRLWGHDVRQAGSAAAAVRMLPVFCPDVFVLDLAMPAVSGIELGRQLRGLAECHDCRLIAISGYADPARLLQAAGAGFDAYLTKPINLKRLQDLLGEEAACRSNETYGQFAVA